MFDAKYLFIFTQSSLLAFKSYRAASSSPSLCVPLGALGSHLSPVPLTLSCCRRHLGFLFAGFELLSCLNNLTGVVLTGGTIPSGMRGHCFCKCEQMCICESRKSCNVFVFFLYINRCTGYVPANTNLAISTLKKDGASTKMF